MGKTRDLFKKIRDTKGTYHANIGTTKDRNGMDLTEAEDFKKMWYIYATEYYSAIKRNGTESFVVMWMNLEHVLQSEISQTEKDKYHMISLICVI